MNLSSFSSAIRLVSKLFVGAALLASLAFTGCSNPPPAIGSAQKPKLDGWYLHELYGKAVTIDPLPTLSLYGPDGKATGNAGVNHFSTEFKAQTGAEGMKTSPILSTKMAGSPERMEVEQLYLQALAETTGWKMKDSGLELVSGDNVIARFSTSPTPFVATGATGTR